MEMIKGSIPAKPYPVEELRLEALRQTNLLDSKESERFDAITRLAANCFDVPICLISLVDVNRQWFLSKCGLGASETHRDDAFCAHAIHEETMLVVEDTLESPLFRHNRLVTGAPHIRFYAGAVLRGKNNLPLGTLCIIDTKPKVLSDEDKSRLVDFALLASQEINLPQALNDDRMRMKLQSNRDPLTNALFTSAFFDEINTKSSSESSFKPYMLQLHITNADYIATAYGSVTADEMVLEVIARLRNCAAEVGEYSIGKLANDRFGVYLQAPLDSSDEEISTSVTRCLDKPINTSKLTLSPTLALCIYHLSDPSQSLDEVNKMSRAYLESFSKEDGVIARILCSEKNEEIQKRFVLMGEIDNAISQDKMHLLYQPKVKAQGLELEGMEVLLRWYHPKFGAISPLLIIEIAEEARLLNKLERWVFDKALHQVAVWRSRNIEVPNISINVSGKTLLSPGFKEYILERLSHYDLSAELLDIEIVESSIFEDILSAITVMRTLEKTGITFSLDDFGTGHSCLSYLKNLPVKFLKIDKSFVDNIADEQEAATVCSGIISLAKAMNIQTVAEGIEDATQSIILKSMRCDLFQGYHYAKPLKAEQLAEQYLSAG